MSGTGFNRREVLGIAGAALVGCGVRSEGRPPTPAAAPAVAAADPRAIRWAPGNELANALEFEEQAQRVLAPETFAPLAGSDRDPFDRITLRPRMNVPTLDMDLGVSIFGQTLFTPILVGPIADLGRYHPEGERALIRGAGEAFTGVVVNSRSGVPFEQLAAANGAPLWFNVYASEEGARERAHAAAAAGAGAIFITVGATPPGSSPAAGPASAAIIDWARVNSIRQGLDVPVVIKGIRSVGDAAAALQHGVQGIVVSNHGSPAANGATTPLDALGPIADHVAGRIAVLADGGFRRGTDVFKGLTLGARAVLIGRPSAWALAAYGSDGVRWMLEMVQNETARTFAMTGVATPAQLTRNHIRVHRWATG